MEQRSFSPRHSFTKEQLKYLSTLPEKYSYIQNEKHMWREISKEYNEKFSGFYREPKVLKQKYHNALNPNFRRYKFSEEEITLLIHLMVENNKNLMFIAKLKGRTEASVKNFAYKNLIRRVQEKLSPHDFTFIRDDAENVSKH
jgi:hypothetical protein